MRQGRRAEKVAKCKWLLVMVSFLVTLKDLSHRALRRSLGVCHQLVTSQCQPQLRGSAFWVRRWLLWIHKVCAVYLEQRSLRCGKLSDLWMWGTMPDCLQLG